MTPRFEVSRPHTIRLAHMVGLVRTDVVLVAETVTWG
jgi:hypothetical protein